MKSFNDLREGYVSHAQRKAVWASKKDGGKGHPDNKNKKEDTSHSDAVKAFLAKGGKIKKLPPGRAQGWHGKADPGNRVKGMLDKPDSSKMKNRGKHLDTSTPTHNEDKEDDLKSTIDKHQKAHDHHQQMGKEADTRGDTIKHMNAQQAHAKSLKRAKEKLAKMRNEGKAYGPTGVSYYVPSGHKDEVNPKTGAKYPERQKPGYKPPQPKKEAYNEPQGQAKRMMSPLQKMRQDKEKADRDKDGKLKLSTLRKKNEASCGSSKKVRKEGVDEVLDTPKAMQSYKDKAKYSKDRATNSAVANILRKTDHSADLKTRAKRVKGLGMADRNAVRKFRKANESVDITEEMTFRVEIEGLPAMFMYAAGPGALKQELRKIVKQPSMVKSVKRVTSATVKKTFRLKAQGRDDDSDGEIDSRQEQTNEARGEDSKGHKRATEKGAGLTQKGVDAYKRKNPGSKLQTAVTGKVKAGSKDAKRRKSFCARMGGMPGPMKDEKGRPTRKAMSLRRWKC